MTTDRELMQQALDALEKHVLEYETAEALRARLAQPEQEPVATLFGSLPVYDVPSKQEPVAWRTFDGEGGYEYRSYEMNENYAEEWAKRNPNHKGWVEPLYADPTPCKTCESLARTVMMDQTSHDTPPRHRELPTLDLNAPLTLNGVPMYPQREWVGLTDMEKYEIQSLKWWDWEDTFDLDGYTRAIEAKLKEKNNGG